MLCFTGFSCCESPASVLASCVHPAPSAASAAAPTRRRNAVSFPRRTPPQHRIRAAGDKEEAAALRQPPARRRRLATIMLAARSLAQSRPAAAALQRPAVAAFRPAVTAPVARRPLRVQAAAEVVEAEVASASPKGGVAHLRFKRGSVFKVRRVLDVMRGRSFEDAILMMEYMPYRACEDILKALKSAAANAKNNQGAAKSKLVVAECFADKGPILKRFRCRAQGRGYKIAKPTFHLTVRLEEQE